MILEKVVPAACRCSVPGSARGLSFETDLIQVRILSSWYKTVPQGKPRPINRSLYNESKTTS